MDNSENQSNGDCRLSKDEIIRGHDSYSKILQNSFIVSTDFLKAFVNRQSEEAKTIDFTKSPLLTLNVKVGFIIAKKKIKKSYFRNRIRRLLKESYRLNKLLTGIFSQKLNIIISLTEKGYEHFRNNPKTKFNFVDSEMKVLLEKINSKLTVK